MLSRPCHLGLWWSFYVFRKLHVRPGERRFSVQEKPMRACLLPVSSIPVNVLIFFFLIWFAWECWKDFGEFVESENKLWKKRSSEDKKERTKGPILRRNQRNLDLNWAFFVNNWTSLTSFSLLSLSLSNSLTVYSKQTFYCWYFYIHTVSIWSLYHSLSSLSWHVRQVAAVQVLVALPYCTVPCCTVLYSSILY